MPQSIIQEARALQAQHRHIAATRQDRRRLRWFAEQEQDDRQLITSTTEDQKKTRKEYSRRIRGLQEQHQSSLQEDSLYKSPHESFQLSALKENLFRTRPPKAEDVLVDDDVADRTSRRKIGLEGSAQPLFFCPSCSNQQQQEEEDCNQCRNQLSSQQTVIQTSLHELFPDARIVATTQKLINMIFVEILVGPHDDLAEMDDALSRISGVSRVHLVEDSTLEDARVTAYMGGGAPLEEQFCGVSGKGVRVAILDSGVDYTHARLGGPGTREAYELAYGTGPDSPENKQVNPDLFPTARVIGGKDFLGESFVHTAESEPDEALPDDNPIDANRHGTMVADAILSVAPQAELLAYKVCTSDTGTCPRFAVLQALEYALDPNGDGDMEDKVDIINLSLGGSYLSSYYDMRTQALERVFSLGVLPVVAAGNEGNIPFVGGPGAKTPNALAVAASNKWGNDTYSMVASYSSRGPGDENTLKPDVAAPSGLKLAAYGTGNEFLNAVEGTSFAAPLAAGALALIKERCPSCSPFALKAILMNNARRHVQYSTPNVPMNDTQLDGEDDSNPNDDAPNSLVGAGEIQLSKALGADIWAYSSNDAQPSVSFGLINAHKEMILTKTVRVINVSGKEQLLTVRNEASRKLIGEDQVNPMNITFSPRQLVLPGDCNAEATFEIILNIDATKAPVNRMTSAGKASKDPTLNDWNEFGGWIVIENMDTDKDISLPYHAIVRQASHLKVEGSGIIENFIGGPTEVQVNLTNHGTGLAQVDAYELLFTSEDDAEGGYGELITPSDFRYIGYRVLTPEGQNGTCDHLLEFAFTTWEKQNRINLEFFQVHIDVDMDGSIDYILFNSGVFTPFTDSVGCIVRNKKTGELKCTGFVPDHSTNTGNTILRVCSNDIGFAEAPKDQQQFKVYLLTATATHLGTTETTDRASEKFHTLEFPQTWISAPSYDIYSGATLEFMELDGSGGNGTDIPLGLMLVSNAYRGPKRTGAATAESETIILMNGPQILPLEVTPDELPFPVAEIFDGPSCVAWADTETCAASSATSRSADFDEPLFEATKKQSFSRMQFKSDRKRKTGDEMNIKYSVAGISSSVFDTLFDSPTSSKQQDGGGCPEIEVPRYFPVVRVPGSEVLQPDGIQQATMFPLWSNETYTADDLPAGNKLDNITVAPFAPHMATSTPSMSPSPQKIAVAPTQAPVYATQRPTDAAAALVAGMEPMATFYTPISSASAASSTWIFVTFVALGIMYALFP